MPFKDKLPGNKLPPLTAGELKAFYQLIASYAYSNEPEREIFEKIRQNFLKCLLQDTSVDKEQRPRIIKLTHQIQQIIPIRFAVKDYEYVLPIITKIAQQGEAREIKQENITLDKESFQKIIQWLNQDIKALQKIVNQDRERFELEIEQIDQRVMRKAESDKKHVPNRMAAGLKQNLFHENMQKNVFKEVEAIKKEVREILLEIKISKDDTSTKKLELIEKTQDYAKQIANINPYKALEIFEIALAICDEVLASPENSIKVDLYKRDIALIYFNFANMQFKNKNLDEALSYSEKVVKVFEKMTSFSEQDSVYYIGSLLMTAKFYFDKKIYQKACCNIIDAFEGIVGLRPDLIPKSYKPNYYEELLKTGLFYLIQKHLKEGRVNEASGVLEKFNEPFKFVHSTEVQKGYEEMSLKIAEMFQSQAQPQRKKLK